ncbi:hypothetical protein [Kibdelosporangium philippinense]|uniref:hypothetical protein n=1 Tax=Kibdelosporangium philippinense TaxID=211113 RepID=UPI003608506B
MVLGCVVACVTATVVATILPGIGTMAIVGLIAATGRGTGEKQPRRGDPARPAGGVTGVGVRPSETVLQLGWVFGGALGVLLPTTFWVGFLVISVILGLGLAQTILATKGNSLLNVVRRATPARRTGTEPT